MTAPRHKTWRSDTMIFAAVFVVVLGVTALTDYLNGQADPPGYLIATLAAASTALFGAVSSDKSKRDREVSATATRAESKADDALGRSDASMDFAQARVLEVQERQLSTELAALQSMRNAVDVKEATGVEVLPETRAAIKQLEIQTDLLAEDIRKRRLQANLNIHRTRDRATQTRATADRAEAKADDALARSDEALKRESEWSQHRNHADEEHDDGDDPVEGAT